MTFSRLAAPVIDDVRAASALGRRLMTQAVISWGKRWVTAVGRLRGAGHFLAVMSRRGMESHSGDNGRLHKTGTDQYPEYLFFHCLCTGH